MTIIYFVASCWL